MSATEFLYRLFPVSGETLLIWPLVLLVLIAGVPLAVAFYAKRQRGRRRRRSRGSRNQPPKNRSDFGES